MEKPLHTTIADACRACMLRQVLAISCFGLCSHVLLGDITDALFRESLFEYFPGILGCLGESSHMTRHDPRKQSQENNFGAMSLKFIFLVMVLALLLVIVLVFSSLWFCL